MNALTLSIHSGLTLRASCYLSVFPLGEIIPRINFKTLVSPKVFKFNELNFVKVVYNDSKILFLRMEF